MHSCLPRNDVIVDAGGRRGYRSHDDQLRAVMRVKDKKVLTYTKIQICFRWNSSHAQSDYAFGMLRGIIWKVDVNIFIMKFFCARFRRLERTRIDFTLLYLRRDERKYDMREEGPEI